MDDCCSPLLMAVVLLLPALYRSWIGQVMVNGTLARWTKRHTKQSSNGWKSWHCLPAGITDPDGPFACAEAFALLSLLVCFY